MKLREGINLSKKAQKTAESFPKFFITALNLLYDLHSVHKFRKPKLSIHRDESTVSFERGSYWISVINCWPDTIHLVDTRVPASNRYNNKVKIADDELPTKLPEFLEPQFASLLPKED